jgi:hypothetical protein
VTTLRYENFIRVDFGGGAAGFISAPGKLEWKLRYTNENVRMQAAAVIENFDYLINCCNQKEQIRRLKLMKSAKIETPEGDK